MLTSFEQRTAINLLAFMSPPLVDMPSALYLIFLSLALALLIVMKYLFSIYFPLESRLKI